VRRGALHIGEQQHGPFLADELLHRKLGAPAHVVDAPLAAFKAVGNLSAGTEAEVGVVGSARSASVTPSFVAALIIIRTVAEALLTLLVATAVVITHALQTNAGRTEVTRPGGSLSAAALVFEFARCPAGLAASIETAETGGGQAVVITVAATRVA